MNLVKITTIALLFFLTNNVFALDFNLGRKQNSFNLDNSSPKLNNHDLLILCNLPKDSPKLSPILPEVTPEFSKNGWNPRTNVVWREFRPKDNLQWWQDLDKGVYWRYLRPNETNESIPILINGVSGVLKVNDDNCHT